MKKILILLFVAVFAAVGMLGCRQEVVEIPQEQVAEDVEEIEEESFVIVAATFPQYDWTRQILGSRVESVELILLQGTAIDLHNFQPTVSDIATISTADLFIYGGGKSDGWVEDALRNAINEEMITINLMSVLEDRGELIHLGHDHHHHHDHDHHHGHDHHHDHDDDCDDEHHHHHGDSCDDDHDYHHDHDDSCSDDHDHHHDHDDHCDDYDHHHDHGDDCDDDYDHHHDHGDDCDDDHDHHHDHGDDCDDDHHHHHHHDDEYDEHIWLSLRNAKILTEAIAEALSGMDPGNADYYQSNLENYLEKLAALDEEYKEMIHEASRSLLVFGDRFPFRYLMHDYHICVYAAFDGCSAETEASFSTIIFLVGIVDEHHLEHIMVIDGSDFSIAETIRDATQAGNQEILMLDSMQSVTFSDVDAGVTFLSIMESNLEVLRTALN